MLWLGDDAAHLRFPWVHGFKCFVAQAEGWQHLAWCLRVRARKPLSLLVPLPVDRDGPGPPMRETIADLELRTWFYQMLERGFPGAPQRLWCVSEDADLCSGFGAVTFQYDLSDQGQPCTPTLTLAADRAALGDDAALRGLDELLARVPLFADWGFAWLQLPRGDWQLRTLGLMFRTRYPDALYVPTLQAADEPPELAVYDHTIYFQGLAPATLHGRAADWHGPSPGAPWSVRSAERDPVNSVEGRTHEMYDAIRCTLQDREECSGPGRVTPIATSAQPAGEFAPALAGLVDLAAPVSRFDLTGILPNDTLWICPA